MPGTRRIIVTKNTFVRPQPGEVIAFEDLVRSLRSWPAGLRFWHSYDSVVLLTYRLGFLRRPLLTCLVLKLVGRGPIWLTDESGRRSRVTLRLLWRCFRYWLQSRSLRRHVIAKCQAEIGELSAH